MMQVFALFIYDLRYFDASWQAYVFEEFVEDSVTAF